TGQYKDWLTGFAFKTGVATKMSKRIQLVLSYQFNQYSGSSYQAVEPLSEDILTGRYKPYANSVMIGLHYSC
ncbi:MAG: porin family protein, partial [bacterium]|nr:porin family protein [bacterium]